MPTELPFVRLQSVSKSYDGKSLVVSNLDLDIAKGEFLTMLGPSGSGKTTCLMMVAGFEDCSAGDIYIGDERINAVPPYKRDIGMVFQSYALFPHMTLAENVAFPLARRGVGKAEIADRVAKALDMVRLAGLGDRYPAQLSGGQQQRVALARAMVFEPRLILMDEPLGALDRRLREHMQIEIKQLHERIGTTIVYVTHDQSEALTMSNRIAVFNKGRIEQVATPEEVYERPATVFVANFMGENNALPGVVEEVSGGLCHVRLADGSVAEATMVDALAPGDRVTVAVRPERFQLASSGKEGNCVAVDVSNLIYNGDHLLVPGHLSSGSAVQLKVPVASPGVADIVRGGRVHVGWKTADCRAFRVE